MQLRTTFVSHAAALVGTLHMPDGAPEGVAILTGPSTSVKEQASGAYAAALAARGWAALAFDHRTFGESGGKPRQLENPFAKAEDISAAFDYVKTVPDLAALPVIGVGVCAGGGYMAYAMAKDHRFSGFAGIAGYYADAEMAKKSMDEQFDAALTRALKAQAIYDATGRAETIPAVGLDGGDVAMPLAEAYQYYGTPRGAVANYVNAFAVQSRQYTLPFDTQGIAHDIAMPTILVHSERALAPSLARAFYRRLSARKRQVWLASAGQIDFYDDPRLIGAAVEAIVDFFAPLART